MDCIAIVKEYIEENCIVRILDDSMVKTKEESDKILKEIDDIFSRYFSENIELYGRNSGLKIVE